jgi:hypothetical protein
MSVNKKILSLSVKELQDTATAKIGRELTTDEYFECFNHLKEKMDYQISLYLESLTWRIKNGL